MASRAPFPVVQEIDEPMGQLTTALVRAKDLVGVELPVGADSKIRERVQQDGAHVHQGGEVMEVLENAVRIGVLGGPRRVRREHRRAAIPRRRPPQSRGRTPSTGFAQPWCEIPRAERESRAVPQSQSRLQRTSG